MESSIFSTTALMIVIDVIIIVCTTLIYHYFNHKYLNKYSELMSDKFKEYEERLESQNKLFTNEFLKMAKSREEELQSHRHLDKELFDTFLKIKQSIKPYCYNTAADIKASRLAIYLFHNGVSSTHGVSFVKMSCICEKVAIGSGVRERLMDHSNIPINLFDDMVEQLIDTGKYIVLPDDVDCSETVSRLFISSTKIKYAQLLSIYDTDNNILGFICAEMGHDYAREEAIKEKESIDMLINQIRPVLAFSDYINVTIETNPSNVQHD